MIREDVNILVVDDVNTMRVQVQELLIAWGFRKVTTAESVDDAKGKLSKDKFDLILCDWHMGASDGMQLLKHVRGDSGMKDMPFILVTAESTKERVVDAVKSGVDDYLVKPITQDMIATKVQAVLKKKGVLL